MRVTATEASRSFSEMLSRAAAGETIEIERHGAVVALLKPARREYLTGQEFRDLMLSLPPVDPGFADDVRSLSALFREPTDPWES